jgi:hypothetical protein
MGYSQGDLDNIKKYIELQEAAGKNLSSLAETYEVISELKRTSNFLDKEGERIQKKLQKTQEKINDLQPTDADYLKKKKALELELQTHKDNLDLAEKNAKQARLMAEHLADNVNHLTAMKATWGSIKDLGGNVLKTIIDQNKYLFEQQKAVKMTELQMGVLGKSSRGFRDNIYKASLHTNQLGVGAKGLGEMQATYSHELGRTVELTEAGLQAMSELATGTILGQENAARFAANMADFGYSAERSADYMTETLNTAHKMGVNAAAATSNMENALAIAQKYNFRGGVKGVQKMVLLSTKFKINMDSITSMAEEVFNPEGAIDMASKLSVLGGAWAQLGDPFSLMFKARNDMAGLTEEIVNAAAGTADFNKETGEFEISSMELHKLREVAKATGISMDELTASARKAAKFSEIKSNISGNFSDDIKDFIASKGRFDEKSGEFKINIQGSDYFVDELHRFSEHELSNLAQQRSTLNERALQAKTFEEMYDNLINQFKSTLLPGFGAFTTELEKGLVGFQEFLQDEDVLEGLADFGKTVGQFLGGIAKFVAKNPLATGAMLLLGKPAMWIARGHLLGRGFNTAVNLGKGAGSGLAGNVKGGWANGAKGLGVGTTKIGGVLGGIGKSGMGRLGALGGLGVLGYDTYQNATDDSLSGSDAFWKTLDQNKGKIIGTALGAIFGLGAGAIGGAAIGTAIDGFLPTIGDWENSPATQGNNVNQDFVSRPGQKPIPFSSADTLIGMKKGGGIDNKLLKQDKRGPSGDVNVNFTRPLKIEGSLTLNSGGKSAQINLDDPILIRELSKLVQERLSTELNGKKSDTPVS